MAFIVCELFVHFLDIILKLRTLYVQTNGNALPQDDCWVCNAKCDACLYRAIFPLTIWARNIAPYPARVHIEHEISRHIQRVSIYSTKYRAISGACPYFTIFPSVRLFPRFAKFSQNLDRAKLTPHWSAWRRLRKRLRPPRHVRALSSYPSKLLILCTLAEITNTSKWSIPSQVC